MERIFIPVDIYFGENCLAQNGDSIYHIGNKALIVTGQNSAKICGAEKDVIDILSHYKKEYVIFNQVKENPELEIINEGISIFQKNNCDFVIGIGGGSPLDAAKAIALGAANNIKGIDIFNANNHQQCFPIIAIPTTSGTGSEVTQYSVLTNTVENKKTGVASPLIFPILAFVDPRFTLSLNTTVTRDTAIDALSHLLEGIYSNKRNPLIYPFIYEGVKLIVQNLPACLKDTANITYRENLMRASLYGGIVIAHTGTTLQHSIGYPLTTEFGLTHGKANGVVMKYIMDLYYPSVKKDIDQLLQYLGMSKDDFLKWLESFDFTFKMDASEDLIEAKINEVIQSKNMANNPFIVSTTQIRNIYYQFK